MKHITFYFDVISPYAYLAFEQLPKALKGLNYRLTYQPVLFAGLLKHHGQLGPAEIEPKRSWTYRQVQWLAHELGIEMQLPAAHPFNPLALLRLAVASQSEGLLNRYVVETLFHHVWRGGHDAEDLQRLSVLGDLLKPALDPNAAVVKDLLKAHTQSAIDKGVFGVPTFEVDGRLFFGLDALPMLAAYLAGNEWFQRPDWDASASLPKGSTRVLK
jgi:2-hydroxychromene-2-carboxylate isomerase